MEGPRTETADEALVTISLVVNGDRVRVTIPAMRTLLETLRYDLGLTGSKQGCDQGDCGACTVLLDGVPVISCLTLAVDVDGSTVETVEGIAEGPRLHPLQTAFIKHGAAQCGFCTPGILVSAKALLMKKPNATREEIKEGLSGNLCRCTGYHKILDAVEEAGAILRENGAPK